MPEHVIRLRGPWEVIDPTDARAEPIRIQLPAGRLPWSDRPVVLRRRFGRPARLPPEASCRIRARGVQGLTRIVLNGNPLEHDSLDRSIIPDATLTFNLPPLRPRNVLELTVSPQPVPSDEGAPPWGSITLVFGLPEGPGG